MSIETNEVERVYRDAECLYSQQDVEQALDGMASDIEIQAKEILRIKARMNDLYVHYTGKDLDTIERAMDRDTFLEADEAKEFGLVDEVFAHRPKSDPAGVIKGTGDHKSLMNR